MAAKIVVPELGESVIEATVGRWLKNVGDRVTLGEPLVELETEKVDLEVGAERAGVLARIERKEGEDVKIGDVLGVIEEAGSADISPAPAAGTEKSAGREAPPTDGQRGTPARSMELPKEEAGGPAPAAREPGLPAGAGGTARQDVSTTPSARRRARAQDVDLSKIPSPDVSGRVTGEDVQKYLKQKEGAAAVAPESVPRPVKPAAGTGPRPGAVSEPPGAIAPAPAPAKEGAAETRGEERLRMSRRRQTIARRLVEAQHTAAMLTTFNEVDMSAVMDLRKRQKEDFRQRHGVGLGVVSFFAKAAIAALRQFPHLNAEIQGDEIVLKHYYDIGVAVAAPGGLVVPVLRDADRMSFAQIEVAIKDFARKAEDGALSIEDLRGGTFTITNGGVFGSLLSTPILNPPQVGILGLHKIQVRPVTLDGQIASRPMMYVALSYDHRIVDGAEAVQLLVRVKQLVEDPGTLLLEG